MQISLKSPLALAGLSLLTVIALLLAYYKFENDLNTLTLYGNIDIRQAELSFRVFGKLIEVDVKEGDQVVPGQILARLDAAPYENALKEAASRVKSIESSLEYANAQLARRDILVKGNSVSEEDFQQAFYNQKTLSSNLAEAQAAWANAKIQWEDTQLKAPSEGIIFTRVREPGTILGPGEPVYVLSVTDPVWVRTYASEPHLGQLRIGMKALIYTDTPSNPVYKGHVGFISPIAEFTPKNVETPDLRVNLVYQIRVFIDNPDEGLRQGMPVTIKFDLSPGAE